MAERAAGVICPELRIVAAPLMLCSVRGGDTARSVCFTSFAIRRAWRCNGTRTQHRRSWNALIRPHAARWNLAGRHGGSIRFAPHPIARSEVEVTLSVVASRFRGALCGRSRPGLRPARLERRMHGEHRVDRWRGDDHDGRRARRNAARRGGDRTGAIGEAERPRRGLDRRPVRRFARGIEDGQLGHRSSRGYGDPRRRQAA